MNCPRFTFILAFCILLGSRVAEAQITSFPLTQTIPQAKSQDELDDYGLVFESDNPKQSVFLAGNFLAKHPESEFRLYVLVHEMYAYETLDNYNGVVRTARDALRLSPNNVSVLATLANAIADHASPDEPERGRLLSEAESEAVEAEKYLDELVRPGSVSREQFGKYKREAERDIIAVLGLIALQRGNFAGAIDYYTKAIALSSKPKGVDHFRLGLAYLSAHQETEGIRMLEQASRLGPPLITALAQKQIRELQKADRSATEGP